MNQPKGILDGLKYGSHSTDNTIIHPAPEHAHLTEELEMGPAGIVLLPLRSIL